MDFDISKENIQPLRGGRNVSQLGLALQAESSQDMRRELQHQREIFENSIRTYQGDDPLENWYQFISWVEQSYPKSGHEGNLVQLLEHCLNLFENDKRYTHDRRFCKLWIKYIDLQQNPLELYQMMHARGLAVGCADLYKAWAYYHEAVGDYKTANSIFELGKQALAQPMEELEIAHKNLIMAVGTHMLYGPDERRLLEKRQALTSLRTYKCGRMVGSVRIPTAPTAGVYPTTSNENARHQNVPSAPAHVYHDAPDDMRGAVAMAPPGSILTAVKRQEAPKENTMKPGPWTTMPVNKKMAIHHSNAPAFTVHIDEDEDDVPVVSSAPSQAPPHFQTIDLNREPPKVPSRTRETYVDWVVSMTIPEPADNRMMPMYPKSRVYADPTTEYSLEELAALRYQKTRMSMCIQTPSPTMVKQQLTPQRQFLKPATNIGMSIRTNNVSVLDVDNSKQNVSAAGQPMQEGGGESVVVQNNFQIWTSPSPQTPEVPKQGAIKFYEQSQPKDQVQPRGSAMKTPFKILSADELAETGSRGSTDNGNNAAQPMDSANVHKIFDDDSNSSFEEITANIVYSDLNASCNTQAFNFNLNAMKVSTPQPKQQHATDVPNCFEQVKNSKKQLFEQQEKTPCGARTKANNDAALFTIYEESKSYGVSSSSSSSSSCAATTKSSLCSVTRQQQPNNMTTISEEHNSYLAQNLMANEALRKSLLGDLLPAREPPQSSSSVLAPPTPKQSLLPASSTTPPSSLAPPAGPSSCRIGAAPSDPFKSSVIEKLLDLVGFPGQHVPDFYTVPMIPRLSGRKETLFFGQDQYLVERVLGKGTFGTVFKATDLRQGGTVALKYQKPANKWEFYICREIQTRLRCNPLRERFMDVTKGYFSDQASILVYAFMPHGSLLDLANQVKQKTGKPMQECLCFYFCIQMLRIVDAMHQVKIIHADIKPDNFLVQLTPDNSIDLQLIDFGCSIDMSLYPPDAAFTRKVTTENFICCEMQENKPWNYHTDLFCVAATTHVILFEKYIELQKRYDAWGIKEKFPRYMKSDLWNKFFNTLLNRQGEAGDLLVAFDQVLSSQFDKFSSGMKTLVNLIKNR